MKHTSITAELKEDIRTTLIDLIGEKVLVYSGLEILEYLQSKGFSGFYSTQQIGELFKHHKDYFTEIFWMRRTRKGTKRAYAIRRYKDDEVQKKTSQTTNFG